MPSGSQKQMTPWTPLLEDTVPKLCHRLIRIITRSTSQTKLLSGRVLSIQRLNPNLCLEVGIPLRNSPLRKLLNSRNMWRTKQIWMVQDRLCSTIAPATSWIRHFGIALAGQLKKILTLIKTELSIESNSTNLSRSTIELWDKAQEN